jgi:hypothetical protein
MARFKLRLGGTGSGRFKQGRTISFAPRSSAKENAILRQSSSLFSLGLVFLYLSSSAAFSKMVLSGKTFMITK